MSIIRRLDTAIAVEQIFPMASRKFLSLLTSGPLIGTKIIPNLMARVVHYTIDKARRTRMLDLGIERIGELRIVECIGRIVRSEAAFKLRRAVTSLEDSRIIVLDLSEVSAVEGGGLGMLIFLERWAHDRQIQFKLFNPRKSVRDRLELVRSIRAFDIASLEEMMALLTTAGRHFALAA